VAYTQGWKTSYSKEKYLDFRFFRFYDPEIQIREEYLIHDKYQN